MGRRDIIDGTALQASFERQQAEARLFARGTRVQVRRRINNAPSPGLSREWGWVRNPLQRVECEFEGVYCGPDLVESAIYDASTGEWEHVLAHRVLEPGGRYWLVDKRDMERTD